MQIILFMLVSAVVLTVALRSNRALIKCTRETPAEIVGHKVDPMSDGLDLNPVVTYCFEGKNYKRVLPIRCDKEQIEAEYPIGKQIVIYIDPRKPQSCSEDPTKEKNGNTLIAVVIVVGLLVLCFGPSQGSA